MTKPHPSWRVALPAALLLAALACDASDRDAEVLVKPPRAATTTPRDTPLDELDAGAGESASTALSWTGCDISKKAYMAECVAEYREQTGIEITLSGGGATRGIRTAVGGMSDMGGTCRHALPGRFPQEEGGTVLTHVAWDALVFFTHPDNPVDGITSGQARGVLTGKLTNWKELGGEDVAILPVLRQQTVVGKLSGVGYMTRLMLFEDPEIEYTDLAVFRMSSGPLEEFVELTPHTIAVTGVSSARKCAVKILELDGIAPNKDTIAAGEYPLFRPLYIATHGTPRGRTKDFVDWLISEPGQAVLSAAGTVSLAEGECLNEKYRHWPTDGVEREL